MRIASLLVLTLTALAPALHGQFGLPTTFAGGNGADGNMFDVIAARQVIITGFDVHVDDVIDTIEVWARTGGGSFVGSENTPGDWTLVDSVPVSSNGVGQATQVALADGIFIGSGQTMGLYITSAITSMTDFVQYTNGNDFLGVAARDATLTVTEGVGNSYPFGAVFGGTAGPGGASRIWNGRVRYERVDQVFTSLAGTILQSGNMFDAVADVPVTLEAIEMNLDAGTWGIEVYATNDGSFVGKETDPSQWTLIGSTTATSTGAGTFTRVPLLFDFEFDGTRGFYVTSSTGPAVRYTAGTDFGGLAADDGTVRILQGAGKGYPFGITIGGPTPGGTSRIWNGRLRYSLQPVLFVSETFDALSSGNITPPRGWLQDRNDAIGVGSEWFFRDDEPASLNGPVADHTNPGTGLFAHTEDSSPSEHAEINLLTPLVVKSALADALVFWVNSNDAGALQNPLAVDVIEQPSGTVHRDIVLTIGETAGVWTRFSTCLTEYDGPLLQIRFRGRSDSGSFQNDVGLDDVIVGPMTGLPIGTGQPPQPGLATLDINDAGSPRQCSPVASNLPGPYSARAHGGGTLDITVTSEPTVPLLFFAGPTNPAILDLGAIGKLDVGNPGLADIVLIGDGNGTDFFNSLFRTDSLGTFLLALPTPAPLFGFSLGFQSITFNSSPAAISLSNAVDVTFIP